MQNNNSKLRQNSAEVTLETHYNKAYPSNMVPPVPAGIPDSGGLRPWTEPNHKTSDLTLKSSTGFRVTAARHEGHVY